MLPSQPVAYCPDIDLEVQWYDGHLLLRRPCSPKAKLLAGARVDGMDRRPPVVRGSIAPAPALGHGSQRRALLNTATLSRRADQRNWSTGVALSRR